MNIWLDGIREPPSKNYVWCKTAKQCMDFVLDGDVRFIDFDHDLGGYLDGSWVANYIEVLAMDGRIPKIGWRVHSDNPVGRRNIDLAMKSAWGFWYKVTDDIT